MRSSVCASGSRCHDAACDALRPRLAQRRHLEQEQDAGHARDQEHTRAEADHRHVDRQPVGLQRGHDGCGVGVEPATRHRQQDQHRNEHEHPQRAVLRPAQHDRAGDQTREARQVDELVHVAPGHPRGGQAAQHDAHQQQPDADVDQGQPGLARRARRAGASARRRRRPGELSRRRALDRACRCSSDRFARSVDLRGSPAAAPARRRAAAARPPAPPPTR